MVESNHLQKGEPLPAKGEIPVVSLVVVESNHLQRDGLFQELAALYVVSLVVVESNHLLGIFSKSIF